MDARGFVSIYNVLPEAGGMTGRIITPTMRNQLSKALTGRVVSNETRKRLSTALKGKKQSERTIAKRAATLTGRACAPTTRAKISAAQIGRTQANQTRASGQVGVHACEGKWRAQYGQTYLAYHTTIEAAAAAVAAFKATGVAAPLRTNNTSGVRGVVAKGASWQASTRVAGKRYHVGTFATVAEAAEAIKRFKGETQ